jgi:inner membrane protein involved in colicin E2 resistance
MGSLLYSSSLFFFFLISYPFLTLKQDWYRTGAVHQRDLSNGGA